MDLAKQQYSIRLQEGIGLFPSLQAHGQTVMEGWVLKELKKPYRFNSKKLTWRLNLISANPQAGRWPDVVSKEIRRARGKDGERLFSVLEFLTPQQVSSFL